MFFYNVSSEQKSALFIEENLSKAENARQEQK